MGTFVVVKRINFLSGGISHAAFGGLGVSFYFGFPPFYGAMIAGLIASSLITVVNQKFKEREDALIGAIWALGMAIGIFFVFLSNRYAGDLFSFLFGDILLTSQTDLILLALITAVVCILAMLFFRPLQAITFDEEYAKLLNLPVRWLYWLLFTLVAISVVALIKVVGAILVVALLAIPAASANIITKSLRGMMVVATVFSLIATLSGTVTSFIWNLPPTPMIVFFAIGLYAITIGVSRIIKR